MVKDARFGCICEWDSFPEGHPIATRQGPVYYSIIPLRAFILRTAISLCTVVFPLSAAFLGRPLLAAGLSRFDASLIAAKLFLPLDGFFISCDPSLTAASGTEALLWAFIGGLVLATSFWVLRVLFLGLQRLNALECEGKSSQ